MNKIGGAVADYLSSIQVGMNAVYVCKNSATHATFPGAFRWSVSFQRFGIAGQGVGGRFDFYMGSAHVNKTSKCATPPNACEVLYCLMADSQASGMTFEDWAYTFGYDVDSRSAERTYHACLEEAQKLGRIFTEDEIKTLEGLVKAY